MQYQPNNNLTHSFIRQRPLAAAAAAAVLGQNHQSIDLLKITRLLNNSDPAIRIGAIKNLITIGGISAHNAILRCVNDADRDVRVTACHALGKMRAHRAKAQLYDALADPNASVRCAAAYALASMGDQQGLPTILKLIRIAGDHQLDALQALNHITSQKFPINNIGLKQAKKWIKLTRKTG